MTLPEYQKDLSVASPILLDRQYKQAKVDKMLAILEAAGAVGAEPRGLAVDVGCSAGFFAAGIAPRFGSVLGIDIDPHALRIAASATVPGNLHFLLADSLRLPLPDDSTDLVICNHVYEHVPSAERLFAEIRRVLKPGGRCYLGAASRLIPVEPHYHLPLLSWLPKPLAHLYMRITGRGEYYYENLRTWWGIQRLIGDFEVQDYTLRILADPDRFRARDMLPRGGWLAKVPLAVWKSLYCFLPTYILILVKRERPA